MTAFFTPSRTAALEKLAAFVPRAGRAYAAGRNFDLGAGHHEHVSGLSPYLRCRLITEVEVVKAILGKHSPQSAEKYVQEVFWRTYWKGWLELRPDVWEQYQCALTQACNSLKTQSGLRAGWQAACLGETDIECFNFWAHELVSTGYLHNHARMWFASIWVFTLKLPWELGADFFLRHLLDGDPASNTLGWRWVAGIQTPGKTYLARTSNISKFTEGRFHPKWQLATEAIACEAPPVPAPRDLPQTARIDPTLRTGFLLHEEDLSPGPSLAGQTVEACAILAPQTSFGPLQSAPHIELFRSAALSDAATRWEAHLGPTTQVADAQAILAWAKANDIAQIVTPYAPVGPVARVIAQVGKAADAPWICQIMHPCDAQAWPHATRGFFAFKKHIPEFLLSHR